MGEEENFRLSATSLALVPRSRSLFVLPLPFSSWPFPPTVSTGRRACAFCLREYQGKGKERTKRRRRLFSSVSFWAFLFFRPSLPLSLSLSHTHTHTQTLPLHTPSPAPPHHCATRFPRSLYLSAACWSHRVTAFFWFCCDPLPLSLSLSLFLFAMRCALRPSQPLFARRLTHLVAPSCCQSCLRRLLRLPHCLFHRHFASTFHFLLSLSLSTSLSPSPTISLQFRASSPLLMHAYSPLSQCARWSPHPVFATGGRLPSPVPSLAPPSLVAATTGPRVADCWRSLSRSRRWCCSIPLSPRRKFSSPPCSSSHPCRALLC